MDGGGSSQGPGDPQQLNRYSYMLNNPIRNTDPSGHTVTDGRDDAKGMGGSTGTGGGPGGRGGVKGTQGTEPIPPEPLPDMRGQTMEAEGSIHPTATGVGTTGIPSERKINPQAVRFSQDSINYRFKDGRTVDELANGLRNGSTEPDTVPAIRLVEKAGTLCGRMRMPAASSVHCLSCCPRGAIGHGGCPSAALA